ncbi:MAG: cysteine--tRNA ligase [Candidatus Shapirobacteria bacterium]
MQKIFLYNTASRKKEELKPIVEGKIGMYSCGPTVYWNQHIGHMYCYVQWDTLVRLMRYIGYDVNWVMNITDVGHMVSDGDEGEDKMEKGAKREGLTVWEVAKKYESQFRESLGLLNISGINTICRAAEHVDEQIELAKKIEKNGYSYLTKTGLVFDTGKFADYAKFANLKLENMDSGNRVEVDQEKKNAWDFLLWITNQPDHIMKWISPWGEGFPGWHIECTAMSTKYLGESFDIHTGGIEHIGVHHTNEIAQGYGAFGHQTANYWVHNGWLTYEGAKMSKSLGNIVLASDLSNKGYDPLALRYLILTSSYGKGLDFTFKSLDNAQSALNKLISAAQIEGEGIVLKEFVDEFVEKISDDLAMPEGMAVIWKMMKSDHDVKDIKATLLDLDKILGLNLNVVRAEEEIPEEIVKLAQERTESKSNKDWAKADELRDKIKSLGYLVEDFRNDCKIRKLVLS